jgi:hypothetical protein
MPNQWFNIFNAYHAIFSPYPRGSMSFDITLKVRVRAFESDAAKWAAYEAQYPGQSANDFYAYCVPENLASDPPEFTLWMDLRHYGVKGLWPVHTLGHEFLHALAYARAVQLGESFPPSDLVDADQLTGLENATSVADITTYRLGTGAASSDSSSASGLLDRSKRILGVAADWYSVTVLGATNGPFVVSIGGVNHTISGDVVVSGVTDIDTGALAAGSDYYVYACLSADVVVYKVSLNSSAPSGFTTSTSTLLGGFHTLCMDIVDKPYAWQANTGVYHGYLCQPTVANGYKYRAQYQGTTAATEPTWPTTPGSVVSDGTTIWWCTEMGMSGRYALNVIPASIWDLTHRARCLNNAGMTYDENTGLWVDIYLASGVGGTTASVYNGTITLNRRWTTVVEDGHSVGKRLLTDHEFQSAANGVYDEAQRYGASAPTTTGGNSNLFTLTLDSAPSPGDFVPGGAAVHGDTSGAGCTVVYKISPTVYLCKNMGGVFTDGEVLHDGTNSADCGTGYPQLAAARRSRIVSNIGCEDIVGVYDQWLLDQGFMIAGANWDAGTAFATVDLEDQRGGLYVQSEAKMVAGGCYTETNTCGVLSRKISSGRNATVATVGARFCCEGL